MQTRANAMERPRLSPEERTARDITKRIRKLRWIGLENEARQLQQALSQVPPSETVLLLPVDTD